MVDEIPWWQPRFEGDEAARLHSVLDSGFINDGPVTKAFEEEIAGFCGAKHAIAVTSGTTALYLALKAHGIGRGDEVIVPDLTFIATANAVTMTGATPVFIDIERGRLGMDPALFAAAITPATKAVVPVHVSGRAALIEEIVATAQANEVAVIEDAAEALGSLHNGRQLGTFGAAGCFSLSPNKTITTGQGGIIVTDDAGLHERLRMLKDQGRPVRGTGGADTHDHIGFNFKFTDLQAAVGRAQFAHMELRLAHLRRVYEAYQIGLDGLTAVSLPGFDIANGECPQWVDVLVPEGRDDLKAVLAEQGIGSREFWHPISHQKAYADAGEYPVAAEVSAAGLWLPSAYDCSEKDIERVCWAIAQWARAGA